MSQTLSVNATPQERITEHILPAQERSTEHIQPALLARDTAAMQQSIDILTATPSGTANIPGRGEWVLTDPYGTDPSLDVKDW